MPDPVVVVPHDPGWVRQFEDEATLLGTALGEIALRIHHIGSTSVPAPAAKPVIDILLEVSTLVELDEMASKLGACHFSPAWSTDSHDLDPPTLASWVLHGLRSFRYFLFLLGGGGGVRPGFCRLR